MRPFNPRDYGPVFCSLLETAPLNSLGPSEPIEKIREQLEAATLDTAFAPHGFKDRTMAQACLSAIWLRFDFLDRSHSISQEIHNSTGSFWHGIMHRREPDYDNAKYWFRRVKRHPVFAPLCSAAKKNATAVKSDSRVDFLQRQTEWDAFAFVDLVAACQPHSASEELCRQIQRLEWELLFDFCYQAAIGKLANE